MTEDKIKGTPGPKPKYGEKMLRVQFNLRADQVDDIKEVVKKNKIASMSEVVRNAIDRYLTRLSVK